MVHERIDEIELPDSVHGVIAARVDLLDHASREALRRCSVMGRVFWPPAVGVDDEVIAALGRRGLVAEQQDSVIEGMREFAFKHALTHDVAYSTLPRAERRVLHKRVGGWLEEVAPGREAEYAELAAYHYDRALEYGDASPEVKRRAFELGLSAGLAALARGATASAERLLGRAVELAEDSPTRAAALIGLGRARLASAKFELAHEPLAEARELTASLGDMRLLAETLGWLSRAAWLVGQWQEALETADAAIDALAGFPEGPELARALARRSQLEMLRGAPEAEAHALETIALAGRVGDGHAEVNARINLDAARANRGVAPEPPAIAEEIIARALELGDIDEAYRALTNFLWSAQAYLDRAELERVLDRLHSQVGDVPPVEGFETYLAFSHAVLVLLPAGRWAEVDRTLVEARPLARVSGAGMLELELVGGLTDAPGRSRRRGGPAPRAPRPRTRERRAATDRADGGRRASTRGADG